jgi:mRNA interferase HicA
VRPHEQPISSPVSVILFDNYERMTGSELKRWLKAQGCTFQESTNHTKVTLGQNVTWLPRHWTKQVKTGTLKKILKDLDLKI